MCIAIVYYQDQSYLSLTIDRDTFAPADIAPLILVRGANVKKKGPRDGTINHKLRAAETLGSHPTGERAP